MQIQKILVCIDGSELSRKVGTLAVSFAKKYQSKAFAFSAYHIPELHNLYPKRKKFTQIELDDKIKKAKECLETIAQEAREMGVDMQTEFLNTKSSPEDAIIEFAEKESIGMIFLGSTGTSMLKKILIGSVASAVVEKAKCIVTVVR
jgi:nucleotide-binding universal stress UspA family protein